MAYCVHYMALRIQVTVIFLSSHKNRTVFFTVNMLLQISPITRHLDNRTSPRQSDDFMKRKHGSFPSISHKCFIIWFEIAFMHRLKEKSILTK